ncbi:hypothetical protein [Desulfonema magnum]|uniref:Uncharacterized protein n=1 Tax=Desulfonema magnum TaxID=45655 RepID=A0A975BU70_9BACT|nr:hypothetical protein [Desulfonema magnum]QTA91836.1 Uncharacterized protein dnm_079100 [Desulfonema magnum]
MSELDKYFQPSATESEHPAVFLVREYLTNKPDAGIQFELRRERDGLTFRPAKMLIHFSEHGESKDYSDSWDSELNRSLIEMGICAISIDNEKERFGLILREMLEKLEIKAGEPSLFSTIFIDILKKQRLWKKKRNSGKT